jgi:hypothetical protein
MTGDLQHEKRRKNGSKPICEARIMIYSFVPAVAPKRLKADVLRVYVTRRMLSRRIQGSKGTSVCHRTVPVHPLASRPSTISPYEETHHSEPGRRESGKMHQRPWPRSSDNKRMSSGFQRVECGRRASMMTSNHEVVRHIY